MTSLQKTSLQKTSLPDLVAEIVEDGRELVELQVAALKTDLGARMGDLGTAIRSWLVAVCFSIVTAILLALAVSATLTELAGVPWFASLWIVTALAIGTVAALVYRARASGRKVTAPSPPAADSPD